MALLVMQSLDVGSWPNPSFRA